jgi:amidase
VSFDELVFASALEQAELIRARQLSPVELVNVYLERIEDLDPRMNAFVTVCEDEAVADARRAEEATGELPSFHGVPLPIKDLTQTAGIRTTFSSKAFAHHVPSGDTAVVRRLRQAGFILLGKTNTPEFGTIAVTESELNGACRSPWNTALTPGGSSGGAAAAVAAGLAPAAQGSDGGGSIRIPASCCGLYGIKPARGRVSNAPHGDGSIALSTSGPITRTVADAAAMVDVMAGYEWGDAQWAPPPERPFLEEVEAELAPLRVALVTAPPIDVPVHPVCARAAEQAATLLEELNHDVDVASLAPWSSDELLPLFMRIWQLTPALYPVADPALLEPHNRTFVERATATSSVEYGHSVVRLQVIARAIVAFFADYDLILTPTLAQPPLPIGAVFEDEEGPVQASLRFTPFTPVANLTGLPAGSLPLGETDDGLPVGVQLIGRPADEATLIRVSAQVERARPWALRRPPAPYGAQLSQARPSA